MNHPADLIILSRPMAMASLPGQSPVPGPWPEPLPAEPSTPPDGVPRPVEPLDTPPQIPPEIREPHQPGEHMPISALPTPSPTTP